MGNFFSLFTRPLGPLLARASPRATVQLIAPGEVAAASSKLAQVLLELRKTVGDQNASVIAVTDHLITLSVWQARLVEATKTPTDFNRDILLLGQGDEWVSATALLDTQCQFGNWISRRLVQELGKLKDILPAYIPPAIFDANGNTVPAAGVISLTWRWQHRRVTRTSRCEFYVLAESDHIDVIFGQDYIASHNLLRINEYAFLPMVQHKKFTKEQKEAIEEAKKRQQEEKAALDELKRKQAEEKNSGSH